MFQKRRRRRWRRRRRRKRRDRITAGKTKKIGVVSPSTFTEQINNDIYCYYY